MKAKLTLNNPLWQAASRRRILDKAVQESAAELESEIKQTMLPSTRKEQPSGRTYRRTAITKAATKKNRALGLKRKKGNANRVVAGSNFHRASAPGQAPAVDTGGLVNATRAKKTGEMRATVSNSKGYAAPLDDGAKGAGRSKNVNIAKRPFFKSTAEKFRPKFKQNIEEAMAGK